MRLPQPLLESPFFVLSSLEEVTTALERSPAIAEIEQIRVLAARGLPPVTSVDALAAMIGINAGIIWSFVNRPQKHYRVYDVPKGKGTRRIASPRVGLKVIQTWIGYHLSRAVKLPPHVFGFVPGVSHIDAAYEHRSAEWAYSVDLANFFGTTPATEVSVALQRLGYSRQSALLVTRLSTLHGFLAQGSPISPVLSNLAFLRMDSRLAELAKRFDARLTRYADDIVFSGTGRLPVDLVDAVQLAFADSPWSLAPEKERLEPLKGRIKVHGLIVNGDHVRLTKGYRNKLRAYRHVLAKTLEAENLRSLQGHIRYSEHVAERILYLTANPPRHLPFDYSNIRDGELTPFEDPVQRQPILSRLVYRFKQWFD